MSKQQEALNFIDWLTQNGGVWSNSIELRHDSDFGYHVLAKMDITISVDEESLIACPFALTITQPSSRCFILSAQEGAQLKGDNGLKQGEANQQAKVSIEGNLERNHDEESLNERQWISSYLVLHLIGKDDSKAIPSALKLPHLPYINILPGRADLLTPLLWSQQERSLLEGSNLYHAITERENLWKTEWQAARKVVCTGELEESREVFSWERWVLANSYITSRSFPSSLLRLEDHRITFELPPGKKDADETDEPYPFLLPGIDLLNHRRAEPVSWTSRTGKTGAGQVGFVPRRSYEIGEQVWNNYGPKGNEELLMAYGFAIPNNPDDTSAVKLGMQQSLPPDVQAVLDRAGLRVDETHHVQFDDPLPTDSRSQVNSPLPEKLTRVVRICCGGTDQPKRTLKQTLEAISRSSKPGENENVDEAQVEMQSMEILEGLFRSKAGAAQSTLRRIEARKGEEGIRDHVWRACREYAKGQHEILHSQYYRATLELEEWEEQLQDYMPDEDLMID